MKKFFVLSGLVLILITGCKQNTSINIIEQVCLKNYCFYVELAQTSEERSQGLMYRTELGQNKGMLFVYPDEAIRSFWMKNTKIPLDIIFIDNNKRVVSISKDTQPCIEDPCPSYKSADKAQYVLEINGGMSDQIGLKVGSILQFR
ncbi:DUF192 domain-containing protein [Patescibacteria group bacterium]|nr:DUF192 domain-containing protein [Patescibacteria group bacterium]